MGINLREPERQSAGGGNRGENRGEGRGEG